MILKRLWLAIAWALIILLLTGLPGNYFPTVITFWEWLSPDKIVHLFIFGVQSFLLLIAIRQYLLPKRRFRIKIIVIVGTIAFAALTEIMQDFVFVRRDGNVYDFIADVLGVFIGLMAYYLLIEKKMANKKLNRKNLLF